jgi:dTMP kinase
MTKRGAFIVLEGCDRSGKSTQSHRLLQSLLAKGLNARRVAYPGPHPHLRWPKVTPVDRTTPIGQMLNAHLTSTTALDVHAAHLLFSANRWESMAGLKAALEAGETVISDRYAYSGIAFSTAQVRFTNIKAFIG